MSWGGEGERESVGVELRHGWCAPPLGGLSCNLFSYD